MIGWLSKYTIGWISKYTIRWLRKYIIGWLSKNMIGWSPKYLIGWLSKIYARENTGNFIYFRHLCLGRIRLPFNNVIEITMSRIL